MLSSCLGLLKLGIETMSGHAELTRSGYAQMFGVGIQCITVSFRLPYGTITDPCMINANGMRLDLCTAMSTTSWSTQVRSRHVTELLELHNVYSITRVQTHVQDLRHWWKYQTLEYMHAFASTFFVTCTNKSWNSAMCFTFGADFQVVSSPISCSL